MTEFFEDFLLPLALTYGMTAKEFWEEEPTLMWAYRKSYMDKMQIQLEMNNQNDWLQGLYIYQALSAVIYNAFGRKQGQPAMNYLEKQLDIYGDKKSQKSKQLEKIKDREDSIKESLLRGKRVLQKEKEKSKGQITM